jgi:hypothetical protein
LFRGVYGDVIGADGEELLVPTSLDQLRELTLGLVVAGKVPPPCLTAGRAHVIAELEHEDSSAEDSPAEASRIVRSRVDPLLAADDSSIGEQLVSVMGQRNVEFANAAASFACPGDSATPVAPSPTRRRNILVHLAPHPHEAFSQMRDRGGSFCLYRELGLTGPPLPRPSACLAVCDRKQSKVRLKRGVAEGVADWRWRRTQTRGI